MDWQPISTVPTSGKVDLFCVQKQTKEKRRMPDCTIRRAVHWADMQELRWTDNIGLNITDYWEPTHWMHPPPPPE